MLDFLCEIKLVIISCVYNFSEISMLITVSYLSSFENKKKRKKKRFLLIRSYLFSNKSWLTTAGGKLI